jgi:hypothetical protein
VAVRILVDVDTRLAKQAGKARDELISAHPEIHSADVARWSRCGCDGLCRNEQRHYQEGSGDFHGGVSSSTHEEINFAVNS